MAQRATHEEQTTAGISRETLVERLNAALAAEGLAAYQYAYYAETVAGSMSHELRELFSGMADSEWAHLKRFTRRVVEVGGTPVVTAAEWRNVAFSVPEVPPVDASDARTMVQDALAIEDEAVRFYRQLADDTRETDPVTWRLVVDVLAEEVEEAVNLRKLLRGGNL